MISYLGPAYAPDTWSEGECAIPVYDTKEDEIKGRVERLLLMVKRRDARIKELEREIDKPQRGESKVPNTGV